MKLIDGKAVAAEIRGELRLRAEAFETKHGKKIGLAVVVIGEDPASQIYVRNKIKACEDVGISSSVLRLPADIAASEAESALKKLAADKISTGSCYSCPFRLTSTPINSYPLSRRKRMSTASRRRTSENSP